MQIFSVPTPCKVEAQPAFLTFSTGRRLVDWPLVHRRTDGKRATNNRRARRPTAGQPPRDTPVPRYPPLCLNDPFAQYASPSDPPRSPLPPSVPCL
ncbi:hypothetical protein FA95DRAFT_917014 [Auriscalpium vulgare]|uniref:Uncharacterized protein n=1 Tax=Auriscalpium vulgare TaxID=40419 RepID=A0ACB8R913_9AGAM|nr:hypothetical protein FA95DRAFT_917014 [Auriscalpium vulgare]